MTSARMSLCTVGGACSPVWQARDDIAEYGLRAAKFLEFKAEDGTTLYGRLLLPPDAPASAKVPVIVHIYGGPAGVVLKTPSDPFDEILARKGFAIFSVDNRGDSRPRSQVPDLDSPRVRRHRVETTSLLRSISSLRSIPNSTKTAWRFGAGRMAAR